jgi:hypothetical protein
MSTVTLVTKLVGSEEQFATKDTESLHRLFRIMREEKLRTPTKATDRLFVRVYTFPAKHASPKIETA